MNDAKYIGLDLHQATISAAGSGLHREVRSMAPEDACAIDMLFLIRWEGRNMAVPLSQLKPVDAEEQTAEAVSDWHYWVAQGYLF